MKKCDGVEVEWEPSIIHERCEPSLHECGCEYCQMNGEKILECSACKEDETFFHEYKIEFDPHYYNQDISILRCEKCGYSPYDGFMKAAAENLMKNSPLLEYIKRG